VADHPRQQDEFAVASQNKAEAAQKAGKFADEITPVTVKTRKGDIVVEADEYIRHGATIEAMQKLRPAFTKDGTVTAATPRASTTAPPATLLMSAAEAEKRGIEPLARIASYATAGSTRRSWAPARSGLAQGAGEGRLEGRRPRPRRGQRGLRRPGLRREQGHGLGPGDRERERRRHRHRPPDRRLGRARAEHAAVRDEARDAKKGLATLCIGGGMGVAMCVERPD
jgi:acetyl-CoA C-acetyltransferase